MESPKSLLLLFDARVKWLALHRYPQGTQVRVASALKKFLLWCLERDIHRPDEVNSSLLETFQRWLGKPSNIEERPLSLQYQRGLLSTLYSCFRWAYQQGFLLLDPTVSLTLPKKPQTLSGQVLSIQELLEILKQPDLDTPLGLRDRAMLEIFYATAIRRQELLNLTLSDLDRSQEWLWIRQGKGGRDRVVPLTPRALHWINRYERDGREVILSKSKEASGDVLFLNRLGKPLGVIGCNRMVTRYIKKVAPEKKGSCHLIRHSVATLLLEQGCHVRYIQELLGHRQLKTTQIYTKVSVMQLKKAYEKYHPSAQSKFS